MSASKAQRPLRDTGQKLVAAMLAAPKLAKCQAGLHINLSVPALIIEIKRLAP